MQSRARKFLLTACFALATGSAAAQVPARYTIYVLDRGAPAEDVTVALDGEERAVTDENGAARLEIVPGGHTLTLTSDGDRILTRDFEAAEDERAQWIVTLDEAGRVAVSVESSHAGASAASEARETPDEPSGPPGMLQGRVVSAETGEAVSGARIYVSGTPVEVTTDDRGAFALEVDPGEYSVSTTHPDFATRTLDGVRVDSGQPTPLNIEITPAGLELEEFVVVEPYVEGSLTSVLAERRESDAVTDVLSAEQISRAGDSDAAGALKRVTGLTLVDGEYIYVRGLGERYSSVLLNGASIPSPDPTRRVVPLDLFPADVIESVVIQKTASAESPADFGGGTVQLRTVGFPESFIGKLSFSAGYNELATFEDGLRDEGGGRDWTGFDDGTRDFPESLREQIAGGEFLRPLSPTNPDGLSAEEIETLGEDLAAKSNYNVFSDQLDPGFGVDGVLGDSFELGDGNRWGFLAAFQYDQGWSNLDEVRRLFAASGGELQLQNEVNFRRTARNVDLGGFLNMGLELGESHELGFNSMLLRQTEDEVRVSEGEVQDQVLQRFEIEWIENELVSNQFTGEHALPLLDWGLDMNLDWQYTDAVASRFEPNTRRYRRDDDDDDGIFEYSTRADSNSQVFGDLEDNLTDWSLAAEVPFELGSFLDVALGFGAGSLERDREAELRTFAFRGQANFGDDILRLPQDEVLLPDRIGPGALRLQESTQPSDNYTAVQRLDSRFYSVDLTLLDDWRITAGLREEDNFQEVTTFSIANPDQLVVGTLEETHRLPSGALTWSYSDSVQVRLGYAETVNRPDLREQSESPYRDPILDLVTIGNPELQSADIKNYDVRWEYYFSSTDTFSAAAFYKDFENPIEKTFVPLGSSQGITLQNAQGAEVYGVEFDVYRRLGFLDGVRWIGDLSLGPLGEINWANYYVAANYTRLDSNVQLDTEATTQTNPDRPLQGASPWVGNLQLGYTNESSGHEWTLLHNEFGERIAQAGTQGRPDIYEQPFPQLDFVYRYRFAGHWRFSLKLQNLLDSEVEFTQGDEVTRLLKRGREISLGLEWSY